MAETATFPTLPQGCKRFTVEQLLIELAPAIGLRAGALHALLHMMKQTKPDDWTRPDREPVFFAAQDVTALSLGKTRRALYNTERQLEALGLVERRVKGNGHRSPYGGCGIVFSKLIEWIPDLLNMAERLRAERRARRTLRNRRSSLARHVRNRIEAAGPTPPPEILEAAKAFASWPAARDLAAMPILALEAHVNEALALCERLDTIAQRIADSTTGEVENFRCHIQENNDDNSLVTCINQTKPEDPSVLPPNGGKPSRERKCAGGDDVHKTQFVRRLTPNRLFELASEELQSLIAASRGDSSTIREVHLIDAATRLLPFLGINWSAWEDAVETMGQEGATLAVLVLDANRTHPKVPVKNPGGTLRAMTARYRAGQLNIIGSLIGLARRKGGWTGDR
jgi:replication initiation protein RepC